ncbi:DNA circularization protein [Candidatus Williamhamiltonella defendens]|uniref:Mu-like prophage DNA circulation protein n=2 Tax=Candidatus Williamhamiltonella defendens TaxID=138072 RepID=C4K4X1_HAMD5|nr:DNA circularization N-terminal domain-containing protein [Candidatus Hamiltonella defensa]ACQ67614.1 Mu-like prophage DNA circulation protein [Candidatus Hamiltonella defensa 5AT (Acyrthosiphon pisum)]
MRLINTVTDFFDPEGSEKWFETLQKAQFRGVPFAVLGGKSSFGRKTAVHEYPYRDKPWVEDLGRATRQLTVKGFLVEDSVIYGGGAVIDQRSNLIAACETAGAGTLIHPTYGELTVSIPSGGLKIVEQWDNGRYFEFTLRAIESGLKVFPVTTSTPLPDEESWLKSIATTTLQFVTTVNSILRKSTALIQTLQSTAVFWVSQVTGTLNQANNLINTMTDVFDSNHYGRFQSSGNSGLASHQTYPVLMQKQKAASAQNRGKVATVGDELTQSVDAETYAGVANALLSAVVLSVSEPQDQIRIFIHLSVFETGNDVPGVDDAVQDAAILLFQRLALACLGRAALSYQPVSPDDAWDMMTLAGEALEVGAVNAADMVHDDTYRDLIALHNTVVSTLTERGANLARFTEYQFDTSLPSLVLSERIYQDPARNYATGF